MSFAQGQRVSQSLFEKKTSPNSPQVQGVDAFGSLANKRRSRNLILIQTRSWAAAHLLLIRLAVLLRAPPAERALGRAARFFSPQDVSVVLW
jgi:hypothetical protein